MYNTHVKPMRDLRNNYQEVSKILKNKDHVIITNNGKQDSVLIPYEHLQSYQNYLHEQYVLEKLAEAEVEATDPNNFLTLEQFNETVNNWRKEHGL